MKNKSMKGTYLGEFEEIVMLTIAALFDEAYGLAIKKAMEKETGRKISIGAVHAACNRLQDKGFLDSKWSETSQKRGGKRKKCYNVTLQGQKALKSSFELRNRLWKNIPKTAFEISIA